jgi:polyferredoxin
MGLQGYIGFGIKFSNVLGFEGLRALGYFLLFGVLVTLLGKLWCGFICPFGLISDWITWIRRRLGISEYNFSEGTIKKLSQVKYVFLAWLIVGPFLINLGVLHSDFYIPFCQMFCPGKPLLPLFAGETRHLALDVTNFVTILVSACSLVATGFFLAGMFFRPRFFCLFCPLLAMIHFFKPLTRFGLSKKVTLCRGCGTCQRVCTMNISEVYLEKQNPDVQTENCVNCGECVASCASDNCLSLGTKSQLPVYFSSSHASTLGKFRKA